MNKISIKVSNGSKIYIENVSHLWDDSKDAHFFRPIKIKETELERHKDHFIYDWSENFYQSKSIPDWIMKSQLLEFEVIIE